MLWDESTPCNYPLLISKTHMDLVKCVIWFPLLTWVTFSRPIKRCCFEDIGTHTQRDKRKLKLLLKGANDAWSSWDLKRTKSVFKRCQNQRAASLIKYQEKSKMIFHENGVMESAFCLDPGASIKTGEKFWAKSFELLGRNVLYKFEIVS